MIAGAQFPCGGASHERARLGLPVPGAIPRQDDRPAQGVSNVDDEALGRWQAPETIGPHDLACRGEPATRAVEGADPSGHVRARRRPDAVRRPRHPPARRVPRKRSEVPRAGRSCGRSPEGVLHRLASTGALVGPGPRLCPAPATTTRRQRHHQPWGARRPDCPPPLHRSPAGAQCAHRLLRTRGVRRRAGAGPRRSPTGIHGRLPHRLAREVRAPDAAVGPRGLPERLAAVGAGRDQERGGTAVPAHARPAGRAGAPARAHPAIEKATRTIIPWLFHRSGRPIKSFRRAWLTACTAAGLSGRIPHDFRRTAVRNLERAGVPRSTAMKMVGHKTESIYRRYAIVDEAMLKEGAAKLQTLHEAQAPAAPVIPLTKATRTKRVSSSTVRVNRARRERRVRAARAKSLPAGEKTMVGWDGIEPPTPGFSDLGLGLRKYA